MNIVFINPSADRALFRNLQDSRMFNLMNVERKSMVPKLAPMVFAALTPEKHNFMFIDSDVEPINYDIDADLVAITAMTEQSSLAYQVAGEFRKRGVPVVIGGIHASVLPDEVAAHCDAVLIGEGESTWPAMLEDAEAGALKKIYNAKDYAPVDVLVSPKVDVVQHDRYLAYPLQATRGCPYDCDFCSIEHSAGHKYRMKPVEQIVAEIKEYEKHNNVRLAGVVKKSYYFVDDNLYVNRDYLKELFAALKPLKIKWEAQGTINVARDDEILSLTAESGCRTISIGFESISPESLREANKPKVNNVDEYEECIRNVARHGIIPGGYFVFGFDSDKVGIFQSTLDFIKKSDMVQGFTSIVTPYPGTKLYERVKSRVFETCGFFYNSWSCVFTPQNMTAAELHSGAHWVGSEISKMDFMWGQLKKFWSHGPWDTKPRLTAAERIALIYIGLKLGLNGMKEYRRFAFRAAFHKEAADFQLIVWTMRRHELTQHKNASNQARNPAV